MSFIQIKNENSKSIVIRSIKSDLHQATLFFTKGKDPSNSFNQKNMYPKTLSPNETLILQVIILPDIIGEIRGNFYFELLDNKILLYSVKIKGIKNIYDISPIYAPNLSTSKLFTHPISITNPHKKVMKFLKLKY